MYNYETYKFNFLSPLFILAGSIFAVYGQVIPAVITFFPGAVFLVSFQGIRVDTEQMKMQKYSRILRFRFGSWVPLEPVQYLTVNRYNIRGSQTGFLIGTDLGTSVYKGYKVNMVFEGKNLYVSLMKGKKETMIAEALKLGKMLNCRVLDYSTHEKKWIL
ncbi:MAG: hypothetical protein JXR52_08310 [Bacteroidales bacterium]|nr:hypothetical protein [Bacteroidales bacterium]MBN2698814.1 hypothetical protein [Bacteroidales bacterium]